ncbi:radical SAM protein [Desulfospira joergensenii]|uniref:radical SAM protein n=1 Tax=Desulfospira joergensenii TaxID=53329 RepID=UPI0003B7486F|nr:radical SAM protein [Desulfospira joergensenii]
MSYKHIFGPVPSRRLGLSLGVDLVFHKVCSLDCIYCECGQTTDLTLERREYVPFEAVQKELDHYFENHPDPDYVTFSGSGEPTLNISIGRVIDHIKEKKPNTRVAVLTNATLLGDPGVRKDLSRADLVIPSLDGVSQKTYRKINRPGRGPGVDELIRGLKTFARSFTGKIWLEVFILPGINDSRQELERLGEIIREIRPDRVQLNTLDRPGTLAGLEPASKEELERVARILDAGNIEIIARVKDLKSGHGNLDQDMEAMVVETIHRRPCTVQDLGTALNLDIGELEILLKRLVMEGRIESTLQQRGMFYQTRKE